MILAPGSQIGARVTTNTATEEYNRKQRQANVTSILEVKLAEFAFRNLVKEYRTGVIINDPLGQIHCPASNDHYIHLKFVLFCKVLKIGDERM